MIPGQGTKIPQAAEQLCLCTAVKIPCAMTKMRHSHINTLKSKNYSTYASLENRQILGFEYEAEEGTALPAQVLRHLPIGNLRFWLNGSEGLCSQACHVPSGAEPALQRGCSSLQQTWRAGWAFRVGGRGGESQGRWREKLPSPAQPLTWWSTQHPISPGCRPGHGGRSASPGDSAQPRWHYKFTPRTFAVKGVGRGLESHRMQPGTWAAVLVPTGRWQCWASKGSCPRRGLPLPGVQASPHLESRVGEIVLATPASRG